MEVTGEEDTKITADANGKVQAVESKITTLQPIALAWQSVGVHPTVDNEEQQLESALEEPANNVAMTAGLPQMEENSPVLEDNQYWYSFHYDNREGSWTKQD